MGLMKDAELLTRHPFLWELRYIYRAYLKRGLIKRGLRFLLPIRAKTKHRKAKSYTYEDYKKDANKYLKAYGANKK